MADFYVLLIQFILFVIAIFLVALIVMMITYLSRLFVKIKQSRRIKRLFYDEGDF